MSGGKKRDTYETQEKNDKAFEDFIAYSPFF